MSVFKPKVLLEEKSSTTILDKADFEAFCNVFDDLVIVLASDKEFNDHPKESVEYFKEMLRYNVFGGKLFRGCLVVSTYLNYVPNASHAQKHQAYILGWVVELFQGWALIMDDVADRSEYRRAKLCWHQVPKVGTSAIIDCNMVLSATMKSLEHYFGDLPCYSQLNHIFLDVLWKVLVGEGLDTRIPVTHKLDEYTDTLHKAAVRGKTSSYTFYFPVALGMALAGVLSQPMDEKLKEISLELGYYFTAQDDYLDVFVDPKDTLKIGTDLQEGKCTWIMLRAMEKCDDAQRKILMDNFGRGNATDQILIKQCLTELGIPEIFAQYEVSARGNIMAAIDQLPVEAPKQVLAKLMEFLQQRKR